MSAPPPPTSSAPAASSSFAAPTAKPSTPALATAASQPPPGAGDPPSATKRSNPPARRPKAAAGTAGEAAKPPGSAVASASAAASSSVPPHHGSVTVHAGLPAAPDSWAAALAPLRDGASSDASVAKACLAVAQHVGSGNGGGSIDQESAAAIGGVGGRSAVASSALLHDASWAEFTSACLSALAACAAQHADRRCRILAAATLGIVARGVYARIRPSPLLYPGRHPLPKQLEEEASMDAPSALVSVALNDADDGVSSAALSGLGAAVLSSSSSASSPGEDELLRECLAVTRNLVTPYAPSLRAVAEEDPSVPNLELSLRVLERAVLPRLVQIVDRVAGYGSPQQLIVPTLPLLTAGLVHSLRTSAGALHGMERSAFAKRWSEVDAVGLADAFVEQLLLPLLGEARSARAPAVALSLLRIAHACPNRAWSLPACRAAASCLLPPPDLDAETKAAHLACLVFATRPLPALEKLPLLQSAAAAVASLPSTVGVPASTVSPGVHVEIRGYRQVRQPARMGLWSEVALSLAVDGPSPPAPTPSSAGDGSPPPPPSIRARAMHAFLTTGAMGKIVAERGGIGIGGDGTASAGSASVLYEEVLLAFCQVGVEASKRFRSTADGTLWYPEDTAPLLVEWTQVAGAILAAFAPCVHLRSDDDMSLLSAGQASYVCLLQEYLFPTGFCNADGCASVKLAGNACPPHLLWDQVGISTALLSRLEADPNEDFDGPASRVVDELVSREIKHGMASHPMRVYALTLAADHWIQGRIASIRKHLDAASSGDKSHAPVLRAPSGREILLALGPKRVLAKLLEGQPLGPPEDDPKKRQRDPARRLAVETAKACVACIEGIALMACDWRRRFGASPETKHLVSVAVGLLQGKVDESPADDQVRAIMDPFCEAAVGRVHAFYESDGGRADPAELSFPVSDLVSQPFKPKIKPLITSSKLPATPREKVLRSHMMQLCRQVVISRAEQAVSSLPVADSLLSNARATNYLRLSLPPLPESRDARLLGTFCEPLTSWGTAVNLSSASSDAAALVAAYTYRRYVRHDGAEEFRVTFLTRAFNITPVSFSEGIRLELGVIQKTLDFRDESDSTSSDVRNALGNITSTEAPLVSSAVVYKQEIKTGDFVTWELSLDPSVPLNNRVLMPSLVFRNVSMELPDVGATWVTGEKRSSVSGDASTHTGSAESKSGEDDFQVTKSDRGKSGGNEETLTEAVTLPGDPLFLTPMVGLLPCPMVFLRDRWGDSSTFRMFWFGLPYSLPPLKLGSDPLKKSKSPLDEKVVELSRLKWPGEAIPGGTATRLWAFSTPRGSRVFCVLAEVEDRKSSISSTLHIRGDEVDLLFALTGCKAARESFISALCPGMSISTSAL